MGSEPPSRSAGLVGLAATGGAEGLSGAAATGGPCGADTAGFSSAAGGPDGAGGSAGLGFSGSGFGAVGASAAEGPGLASTRPVVVSGFRSGCGRRDAEAWLEDGAGCGGAAATAAGFSGGLTGAVRSAGGGGGAGCPETAVEGGAVGVAVDLGDPPMKGKDMGRGSQIRTAALIRATAAPIQGQSRRRGAEDARCTVSRVGTFAGWWRSRSAFLSASRM